MVFLPVLMLAGRLTSHSPGDFIPRGPLKLVAGWKAPDWAVHSLGELREAGLIQVDSRTDGLFGSQPQTRYYMAVLAHAAYMQLKDAAMSFASLPKGKDAHGDGPWPHHFEATIRLLREFRKELAALGVDEAELQINVSEMEAAKRLAQSASPRNLPFTDVPKDHWAAKSVQALKSEGLLKGYPDGSYRGGN